MRIAELIDIGVAELAAAGVFDSLSDVYLLLGHCLDRSRTQLLAAARDEVSNEAAQCYLRLLARRIRREPVAYILGEQEFWSLPFQVNPGVLIPRPETEFMLEMVLRRMREHAPASGGILDLCCGSGVIAIVLALELGCEVTAVDISETALAVARENCRRHRVQSRVRLVRSDLFTAIAASAPLALVVSNPPYVSRVALQTQVEPEVAGYEPRVALDGGEAGLEVIHRIRYDLPRVLAPGGQLFMEIGADQGDAVAEMFRRRTAALPNFSEVAIIKDYAGHDRVLHAIIETPGEVDTWRS